MGLTHTVSGDVAHFRTPSRVPITSVKLHCYPKQEGSGDPSTTNIRPLHGWAELNLSRCHKNLIKPYYTESTTRNGLNIIPTINGIRISGTAEKRTACFISSADHIPLSADSKVVFSLYINGDISQCENPFVGYYKNSGQFGASIGNLTIENEYKRIWTVSSGYSDSKTSYFDSYIYVPAETSVDFEIGLQMEEGSIATSYEPFSKEIYHAEATGGTPAGGYLDMISGVFHIEISGCTNPIIATATTLSSGYKVWLMTGGIQAPNMTSLNINEYYSSMYKSKAVSALTELTPGEYTITSKRLVVCPHDEQQSLTKEQANEWLKELKCTFLYPLLTPTTFQFFNGIELKSYLDHNNFWSDANDITEVSYEVTESKDIQAARKRFEADEDGHHKLVRWNQRAPSIANGSWGPYDSTKAQISISGDVLTRTMISSAGTFNSGAISTGVSTAWIKDHIYYYRYNLKSSVSGHYMAIVGNEWTTQISCNANEWTVIKAFKKSGVTSSRTGSIWTAYSVETLQIGDYAEVKDPILIDLTQMFGAGNEPSTVAEFERICALNGIDLTTYQPYDSGSDRWLIVP